MTDRQRTFILAEIEDLIASRWRDMTRQRAGGCTIPKQYLDAIDAAYGTGDFLDHRRLVIVTSSGWSTRLFSVRLDVPKNGYPRRSEVGVDRRDRRVRRIRRCPSATRR